MTTKAATGNGLGKQDAKYRDLIDDGLQELKQLEKESLRQRAKIERLRTSSRRTLNDTWEVWRRVEATL